MENPSEGSVQQMDKPDLLKSSTSSGRPCDSSRPQPVLSSSLTGYISTLSSNLFHPSSSTCQMFDEPHSLHDYPHSQFTEQPRATSPTTANAVCINLAREAEREAMLGETKLAIQLLERAVHVGTDNLRLLCSIYCQMGNYYSHLGDHEQALQFFRLDFMLSRQMGDLNEEAKAISNMGIALKNIGIFANSIVCCSTYLKYARKLGNKTMESRALYNLGQVYHSQAKCLARSHNKDGTSSSDNGADVSGPGQYSEEVRDSLLQATNYYEQHLALVEAEEDRPAQGRVCGNLGNAHYMLGNFQEAIKYYDKRLVIAREFGDKLAERRVHFNLGYAYIYTMDYEAALQHFMHVMRLALLLGDPSQEAQACFNVGAVYALLKNYQQAASFHERHLEIAKRLNDVVGEARVDFTLCKCYMELNRLDRALFHGQRSLHLYRELRDNESAAMAEAMLEDIRRTLGDAYDGVKPPPHESTLSLHSWDSIEERVMNTTGDSQSPIFGRRSRAPVDDPDADVDAFFEMLSRLQSRRMDEQRCSFHQIEELEGMLDYGTSSGGAAVDGHSLVLTPAQDAFLDRLAGVQGSRMNDQRASLSLASTFPGLRYSERIMNQLREDGMHDGGERLLPFGMEVAQTNAQSTAPLEMDDSFFDRLMRLQGTRINDQRSSLPEPQLNVRRGTSGESRNHVESHRVSEMRSITVENGHSGAAVSSSTVPEDDIFSHIMRLQSSRLDEQRCTLPPPITKEGRSRTQRQDSKKGAKHRLIAISNSTGLVPSAFLKRGKSQT